MAPPRPFSNINNEVPHDEALANNELENRDNLVEIINMAVVQAVENEIARNRVNPEIIIMMGAAIQNVFYQVFLDN